MQSLLLYPGKERSSSDIIKDQEVSADKKRAIYSCKSILEGDVVELGSLVNQ